MVKSMDREALELRDIREQHLKITTDKLRLLPIVFTYLDMGILEMLRLKKRPVCSLCERYSAWWVGMDGLVVLCPNCINDMEALSIKAIRKGDSK